MKNQITIKITPDAICGWKVLILTDGGEISWHASGSRHTAQLIAKHIEKELNRTRQPAEG